MNNAVTGRLSPRGRLVSLVSAGGVMLASFWVIVSMALTTDSDLAYDVRGARYAGPLTWPGRWLHLGSLKPEGVMALYLVLVTCLALAWIAALYLVRSDTSTRLTAVLYAFFGLFILLFLFIPPFQSRDIFSYAFHARAMSVYHANPYILVPAAERADVFYPLIGWKYNASVYGPVFNVFSLAVVKAAGGNVASNVLGFKMMATLFFTGSLPIVFWLTKKVSPGRENLALAACAWCPLLVFHLVGGGHNDAVMVFFVLAGFLLYSRARPTWGLVLVVLAAMVKLSAGLVLLPYLVLYIRKRKGRLLPRLASAGAIVVLLPALMYLPFWGGPKMFESTLKMNKIVSFSSVPRLLAIELQGLLAHAGMGAVRAETVANSVMRASFTLLFIAVAIYLLTRVKDYRSMVSVSAGLVFAWFLTSSYVLPWYLALGFVLAVIAGWNLITAAYVTASVVFLLYHVPKLTPEKVPGTNSLGANVHLSLPMIIVGLALLGAWARSLWLRRKGAAGVPAENVPGPDPGLPEAGRESARTGEAVSRPEPGLEGVDEF